MTVNTSRLGQAPTGPDLHLDIEALDEAHLVRVNERRLSLPLVEAFARRVRPLTESHRPRLALDLSRVHSLDGAALGCLMDVGRRVAALDGAAVLVGLQERVDVLVRMVRLHHRMPVVARHQGALAALRAATR